MEAALNPALSRRRSGEPSAMFPPVAAAGERYPPNMAGTRRREPGGRIVE